MCRMAVTRTAFAALLSGFALVLAHPSWAQTYDPAYPVCMHIYGDQEGDRMDCIYTSLAQCRSGAAGRAAMCIDNPHYAPAARKQRGHRQRSS